MFSPNVFSSISSSASVSRFPRPNCSTWQPIFPPVCQVPAHQVSRVSVDYRLYADHMRKATIYNSSDFWLQGCKIKMDDSGNIPVKRIAKSKVYIKTTSTDDNAVSTEILKLPNNAVWGSHLIRHFCRQVSRVSIFLAVNFLPT